MCSKPSGSECSITPASNSNCRTPFGWVMQCPPGTNPRTVRNFPMQSTGSEILHVACIMAERRSIPIVAPVHDAVMVETAVGDVEEVSAALDRVMRDASAVVLRGYELPTDVQIVDPASTITTIAGSRCGPRSPGSWPNSNRRRQCHEAEKSIVGCPVEWFVLAFDLTRSKEQFALALYLYRRACITPQRYGLGA